MRRESGNERQRTIKLLLRRVIAKPSKGKGRLSGSEKRMKSSLALVEHISKIKKKKDYEENNRSHRSH